MTANEFHVGQLVWAKVHSYPFWPAAVVPEFGNLHYDNTNNLIHVKFFGENQRSWVSLESILKFDGTSDQLDSILSKTNKKYHNLIKKSFKIAFEYTLMSNAECIIALRQSSKFTDQLFDEKYKPIRQVINDSSCSSSDSAIESPVKQRMSLKKQNSQPQSKNRLNICSNSRQSMDEMSETTKKLFEIKFNSFVIPGQNIQTTKKYSVDKSSETKTNSIKNYTVSKQIKEEKNDSSSFVEKPALNDINLSFEPESKRTKLGKNFSKPNIFDPEYESFLESTGSSERLCDLKHGYSLRKRTPSLPLYDPIVSEKSIKKTESKIKVNIQKKVDENENQSNSIDIEHKESSNDENSYEKNEPQSSYASQDFKINAIGFKPMIKCMVNNYHINSNEKICSHCLKLIDSESSYDCFGCYKFWHNDCYKTFIQSKGSEVAPDIKYENGIGQDFKCFVCQDDKTQCFICGSFGENLAKCKLSNCHNFYHKECIEMYSTSQNDQKGITCPHHSCITCFHRNPENLKRPLSGHLLKCAYCPLAFHASDFCVPAGYKPLGGNWIKCPRHANLSHKNSTISYANFCYACGEDDNLMHCSSCPTCFHADCIDIDLNDTDIKNWKCPDCKTGKFLYFGQIVWVKYMKYPWWPGQIVHSRYASDAINKSKHQDGQFIVHFFGSNDYVWTFPTKVYLYHDGDDVDEPDRNGRKKLQKAILDADIAYQIFKMEMEKHKTKHKETFKYIFSNVPLHPISTKKVALSEIPVCDCMPYPGACSDENCINVNLKYECNPKTCPAKNYCQNQKLIKRLYPKFQVIETKKRGFGLFCSEDIKQGDFVNEYVGQLIDKNEFDRRVRSDQENNILNLYYLHLDADRIIDARLKSNNARFINHSCDPNLIACKWLVNGDYRIGFFAIHDIKAGTELTFNYNLSIVGKHQFECYCGSKKCIGLIGKSRNKLVKKCLTP